MQMQLTAIIARESAGYVSLCPELDIVSQGDAIEEARDNLREEVYVTRGEVAVG
jgi:predicted RNase H-like HicB family nuclease